MRTDKKIMVVEDSASVRRLLTSTLQGEGFQMHEACDGAEALATLSRAQFDMVISDLNMPEMNGAELVSHVRALPGYRFTPFIILSSETDDEKKALARRVGASAWLNKPFRPEQLLKVVQMVLG